MADKRLKDLKKLDLSNIPISEYIFFQRDLTHTTTPGIYDVNIVELKNIMIWKKIQNKIIF